MPSINSKYLEVFSAKQFRESVSEASPSNVYFTIGRVRPWNDDNNPPVANTSVAAFYDMWHNMTAAKKLTGNNIRHVIPRHNWANNSVYVAYDDISDSLSLKAANSQFYVVTDEWNVYKCLSNNKGVVSNTKPTSTITSSDFQTIDGYVWKYMYTVASEDRLRFVTKDYIPVKTLSVADATTQWLVQSDAIDGAIHIINVDNAGTGYTSPNNYIIIKGDGVNANAYPIVNTTSGQVTSIVVDNKGSGYRHATATLYTDKTTATGAVLRPIMSPTGGHGSDALTELGGSYLMIDMQFDNDEVNKISVANDFRQVSLIEDPFYFTGTSIANIASNTIINQTLIVQLNGTSVDYIEDEFVYQGSSLDAASFKGVVVEWDSSNNKIKLSNTEGTIGTDLLVGQTSTAGRYVSSTIDPDLQPFTGKLLYINNIVPIERATDQAEDFKVILNF